MPQLLAIDYGRKRTGLAISDPNGSIVTPLAVVDTRGSPEGDAQAVLAGCRDFDVDGFVVGLPLNMDGTEGSQAKMTRAFGDALAKATSKPVHYWDERLSSVAAEEMLEGVKMTRSRRRRRVNPIAAQIILQDYLANRCNGDTPETAG